MIPRKLLSQVHYHLQRGKSILLLGPRQVGKTTLLEQVPAALRLNLIQPQERQRYEARPELLEKEIMALPGGQKSPLIILDEIQRVPLLLDVAQDLIDRKKAQFILTGSSVRKLRRSQVINLLPGRIVKLHLDPFCLSELETFKNQNGILEQLLLEGSLPGIFLNPSSEDRTLELKTYVETYLEEEVRSEALVRNIGVFSRFLELAAIESGRILNFSALGTLLGVSKDRVSRFFEILWDCLIAEKVEPITQSLNRKKLTRSSRFLMFDPGLRRVCAKEGLELHAQRMGALFEEWVGLELIRFLRLEHPLAALRFWRDPEGPEVDWVVEKESQYIPIEVKWSTHPSSQDAKALKLFLKEYPQKAKKGFIVCRTPRRFQVEENILALPWIELHQILTL